MYIEERNGAVFVSGFGDINLGLTLDCGQAFRWKKGENGMWYGTAYERSIGIKRVPDGLEIYGSDVCDVQNIWSGYFDLNRDYDNILSVLGTDPHVRSAIEKCGTVRILNQEPWEALCSFIISACNNIPRIKGIVERMCTAFGNELSDGSFSFPTADAIAAKTEDDLSVLRAGFRAPYILDAAKKVAEGEIDLSALRTLSEKDARKALMGIKGVGVKVADCTLLFSLGFSSVFPVDRHIKRACGELYPDGLPECFAPFAGLAQQYIFNEQRTGSDLYNL